MSELVTGVVAGLVAGLLSPILLAKYDSYRREKDWAKPRKELLLKMLNDPDNRFKSINKLSRTTGTTLEECRTLLIEIGARGARLKSGGEGWALISRAPLQEDLSTIHSQEDDA